MYVFNYFIYHLELLQYITIFLFKIGNETNLILIGDIGMFTIASFIGEYKDLILTELQN